jgi:mRNA-degrading endonuclease toxin of MazEF toxin-antitoxin module
MTPQNHPLDSLKTLYFVPPTTTQPGEGSWYVQVRLGNQDEYVCLNQIRTIDHGRLQSTLGQVDTDNFKKVKDGFMSLYT